MKRIVLAAVGILMGSILAFAGGGGQAGSSADGLTTLKLWGMNKQRLVNQTTAKLSDLYDGTLKSRMWDLLVSDLAKRGIKLEMTLVMQDQMATAFQTLLASGRINEYDWISPFAVDEITRLTLVEQGRFAPLNKAIEQYSSGEARDYFLDNPQTAPLAKRETLEDGNFYWLSQYGVSYLKDPSVPWGSPLVGMIRQDWLDKLDLSMPKTPDEFYNALLAFQQRDVNGNGVKDETAVIPETGFGYGIPQWFGLGHDLVSAIDSKAVSPWYQSGVKDFFTYMNRLYRAGLVSVTAESGATAANIVGYFTNYGAETWEETNVIVPTGAAPAYYNPVVIQALPNIPARVFQEGYGQSGYTAASMHAIPAGSKNIEKTVKLIDYTTTDDWIILNTLGIKGYTYDENPDGTFTTYLGSEGLDRDFTAGRVTNLFRGGGGILLSIMRSEGTTGRRDMEIAAKSWGITGEFRKDFFDALEGNRWPIVLGSDSVLAFPTKREVERIAAISPDLTTYSNELIAALIIGEKSLSNWDSYIADLKRLGLDEYIGIYQARMDRGR